MRPGILGLAAFGQEAAFPNPSTISARNIAYRPIADARSNAFEYFEAFYHRKRRHRTLGQFGPLE